MERQSRSSRSEVLTFEYCPLEFSFRAIDAVSFMRHPGNTFRGALGNFLRLTAAPQEYAAIFEPVATGGPSGFRNPPRPFVLRCAHLRLKIFMPGDVFRLRLNVFDIRRAAEVEAALRKAFACAKDEGIGLERNRAELLAASESAAVQSIPLDDSQKALHGLGVEFQTPTDLTGYDPKEKLSFGLLFRRVRDRISSLRSTYGDALVDVDFRELGERADLVEAGYQDLENLSISRRSSRTGRTHPIGGFDGFATFRGDLTEFLPWLQAAKVTGVGRHTTWGNGEITVTVFKGN